jgi:hypothetical protein
MKIWIKNVKNAKIIALLVKVRRFAYLVTKKNYGNSKLKITLVIVNMDILVISSKTVLKRLIN